MAVAGALFGLGNGIMVTPTWLASREDKNVTLWLVYFGSSCQPFNHLSLAALCGASIASLAALANAQAVSLTASLVP